MASFVFFDPPVSVVPVEKLSKLRSDLAYAKLQLACMRLHILLRKTNFNPNQPRTPAGSVGGGQWTGGGGSSRPNSGIVLSDAVADNFWKPGSRVAQAGRGRGSTIRVGGQIFDVTPAQEMMYSQAENQGRVLLARIHEVDPNWQPTRGVSETFEGAMIERRAEADEARARLAELSRLPPEQLIQTYRNANTSPDLFKQPTGLRPKDTVAVSRINQAPVFGVNSTASTYTGRDRRTPKAWF